jgi:hypothetical protein
MIKVLLLLACSTLANNTFSQTDIKDSLFRQIAKDICKEINDKDSALSRSTSIDIDLGLIMMPAFARYSEQLKTLIPGFEMNDALKLETLSAAVGEKLAFGCPAFLKLIAGNKNMVSDAVSNSEQKTMKGKLVKIIPGDFTAIQILSEGVVQKLWWMQYFDGSTSLLYGNLADKELTISYIEQQVFSVAEKGYISIKVLTKIE